VDAVVAVAACGLPGEEGLVVVCVAELASMSRVLVCSQSVSLCVRVMRSCCDEGIDRGARPSAALDELTVSVNERPAAGRAGRGSEGEGEGL